MCYLSYLKNKRKIHAFFIIRMLDNFGLEMSTYCYVYCWQVMIISTRIIIHMWHLYESNTFWCCSLRGWSHSQVSYFIVTFAELSYKIYCFCNQVSLFTMTYIVYYYLYFSSIWHTIWKQKDMWWNNLFKHHW